MNAAQTNTTYVFNVANIVFETDEPRNLIAFKENADNVAAIRDHKCHPVKVKDEEQFVAMLTTHSTNRVQRLKEFADFRALRAEILDGTHTPIEEQLVDSSKSLFYIFNIGEKVFVIEPLLQASFLENADNVVSVHAGFFRPLKIKEPKQLIAMLKTHADGYYTAIHQQPSWIEFKAKVMAEKENA